MKTIFKYLLSTLAVPALLLGTACSGSGDDPTPDEPTLTLKADKATITADGTDKATFTVRLDGADVTSQATIRCTTTGETLSGATFTATEAKTYDFVASCEGNESPKVSVTATAPEIPFESQFRRHVAVMKFTGAHCAFCPDGSRFLDLIIERFKEGNVHIMQLYSRQFREDDIVLDIPVTDDMEREYLKGNGYPSMLIDQRDCWDYANNRSEIRPSIQASLDEGAHCGVAVESAVEGSKVKVKARLTSERTENYRLAVYVLENNIIGEQLDGGRPIKDYNHSHVVRGIFSPGSYKGDNLGEVAAGEEIVKEYAFDLDAAWAVEECSVYVLALDAEGHVNNLRHCALKDGLADYDRLSEE